MKYRLFFVLFILSLVYCSVNTKTSEVITKDSNNCFITYIVETDEKVIDPERYTAIKPSLCTINYFYVISHYITYDEEFIEKDESFDYPYVIRSNYNDNGYLPFIMSLLHNSTYTIIVKDRGFKYGLPDGDWIDRAIQKLELSDNILTCNKYNRMMYGLNVVYPEGCMFMKSILLRSLFVNTEFRKNEYDPFFYISQSFRCLYSSNIDSLFCPGFQSYSKKPWYKRLFSFRNKTLDISPQIYASSCREALSIEPIKCGKESIPIRDVSIMLSQYKRTYIYEQIEAIYQSSISIHEIVVYQNIANQNYKDVFKRYPQIKHIWSTNWNSPFFLRHLIPLLFTSDYHIVFDDDIIPGKHTISKLLRTIRKSNAPTGVGGRVISESNYETGTYQMICVDCKKPEKSLPVDYVIQVYAKNYVMSKVYWRYRPWTHRNSDDMHGSLSWYFECHRYPIRPLLENYADYKNYGEDSVASYLTKAHNIVRPQTYRHWLYSGFKSKYDIINKISYPKTKKEWEEAHLQKYFKYFYCICYKKHNNVVKTQYDYKHYLAFLFSDTNEVIYIINK